MECAHFYRFIHSLQIIAVSFFMFTLIAQSSAYADVNDPRGWGDIKFGDSIENTYHLMELDGYQVGERSQRMRNFVRAAYEKVEAFLEEGSEINNKLYQYIKDAYRKKFKEISFYKKINNKDGIQVDIYYYDDKAYAINVSYPSNSENIKKMILDDLHRKYGKPTYYVTVEHKRKMDGNYSYITTMILPKQLEFLRRHTSIRDDIRDDETFTSYETVLSGIRQYGEKAGEMFGAGSHKLPVWCVGSTLIFLKGRGGGLSFEDLDFVKHMVEPINKFMDEANKHYGGGREERTIKGIQDNLNKACPIIQPTTEVSIMKLMLALIAAFSMVMSLAMAREACALVGFPPGFAFGRLVITDGGQTVDLHHPTDPNSGVQHLRLGLSSYTIVDAWWERDGSTAKIMIHVVDKSGSSERDMLLGSAQIR